MNDLFKPLFTASGSISSKLANEASLKKLNLYDALFNATQFLDNSYSITERLLCIKYDITQRPVCNHCGAKAKRSNVGGVAFQPYCSKACAYAAATIPIDNGEPQNCIVCSKPSKLKHGKNQGYSLFCSKECQSKHHAKTRIGDYADDYDWWYDARIVQKLTIKQIMKQSGLSEPTVTSYLRKFKLVSEDERKVTTVEAHKLLSDKEWFARKYYDERMTLKAIAAEAGVPSGLGPTHHYFKQHEFVPRPPNSYDRKFTKVSKPEKEILDYIRSIYDGEVISGNRTLLGSRELDIYVPDKNFAIEFNGLFYHAFNPDATTESGRKGRYYHQQKTEMCEERGVYLMQIFEDEWRERPELFKSMIRSRLGLNEHRIYARQCHVKIVSLHDKNEFFNENHAQGQDKSSLKLGLYHNDLLVSVMTFVQNKYNKGYDWELNRFATLSNHTVVGGFSKLLKYAIREHGVSGLIVSYADRRYSQGNVYIQNGFELIRKGPPGYYYIQKPYLNRMNRLQGTKKNLAKLGGIGETETQMAKSIGWKRIYDCGVLTFVFNTSQ